MQIEDIKTLIEQLDATPIREFEYTHGAEALRLVFSRQPAIAQGENGTASAMALQADTVVRQAVVIRAQNVGIYTRGHPLGDMPPASQGDLVLEGQHLGYISVASVVSAVQAPCRGRFGRHIVQDGCVVGYGDPLVEMEGVDAPS
ncbi:hypothetical protein [Ralstonia holmesii]|uniref:Lipoyl-binding domain-containing protein n=1 Tax=Ralstonia holmesii TaxID=3058602 RepID=A0ABC8QED3_9RALS|nr:hypothetical protein [Ralstonia sp. LMG 32967]CAJ0796844.1 hypothetical protein LMG18096_03318 [Ralstonia sp. LMG 32967]CAJ0805897.1 hypothetical protein LMG18093_00088 [Ralstonia sp. LMG 32967]